MRTIEGAVWHFLSGTTCGHWVQPEPVWVSEFPFRRFIVLRKDGHSEYTGSYSGSTYCATFYALVDLRSNEPTNYHMSRGLLLTWEGGRWTKARAEEARDKVAKIL